MGIIRWIINILVALAIFVAGAYVYEGRVVKGIEGKVGDVRQIPAIWKYLPFLDSKVPSAVYPYVYLDKELFAEYANDDLEVWTESVLIHERYHLKREAELGPVRFGVKYITSRKFRLVEEFAAIEKQMEFLKEKGEEYPFDTKVEQLVEAKYMWSLDEEEAKEKLQEIWDGI